MRQLFIPFACIVLAAAPACSDNDGATPPDASHDGSIDAAADATVDAAVELCNDGLDNEGDGQTDCDDVDCADALVCRPLPSRCGNMTEPPLAPNVLVLIFDPVLESENNQRLTTYMNWNDPHQLTDTLIQDVYDASCGFVQYNVTAREVLDAYPPKQNYELDDDQYLSCLSDHDQWQCLRHMNYFQLFVDYELEQRVIAEELSEIWLWGAPWMGFDEYGMKIPSDTPSANPECTLRQFYRPKAIPDTGRTLTVMGFSYERGPSEMEESYEHRIEGFLSIAIAGCFWEPDGTDPWSFFTWIELNMPGQAQCGGVHYAPNSVTDYDWSSMTAVESACDDWYDYPNLPGNYLSTDCTAWGCDGYEHKKWWMNHLPHTAGTSAGHLNNWWKYIVDFDNAAP